MPKALSTFTAFIDESGCSGGKFGEGSSEFLVMGATVIRDKYIAEVLKIFDAARDIRASQKTFKKFSKENDINRYVLTSLIGQSKVRTCFVAIHKPSMQGTYIRDNHANEYNYLFKILLERISWIVRDAPIIKNGNGPCRIVLSEQRMYPYEDLFDYLDRLKAGKHNCSAAWEHLSDETPSILQHEDETPVHIADIAASSFAMAIEPKSHGITDDRYIRNLSPTIYCRYGRAFGVKLFPEREMRQRMQEPRFSFLKLL